MKSVQSRSGISVRPARAGLILVAAIILAAGGMSVTIAGERPSGKIYILKSVMQKSLRSNYFDSIDAVTGKTLSTVPLGKGNIERLACDPSGRFWAGYAPAGTRKEDRVHVFSEDGAYSNILRTSSNPEAGIAFSSGKTFVACTENGFSGAVDVFDLKTLKHIKSLKLVSGIKNAPYYLTSIAANGKKVVACGMTSGPEQKMNYAIITLIDSDKLKVIWRSRPLEGVDVWTILPFKDSFVLLNNASAESREKAPPDILQLNPDNSIRKITAIRSPLWGALQGDVLFSYHNAAFNSVSTTPQRELSSYDLKNGKLRRWPLPDGWDCSGIAVSGGRIFLLDSESPDRNRKGIFVLDTTDGKLTKFMGIPGIRCMLFSR